MAVLRPGDPSGKHLRNPLRRGGTIAASRKETITSQGGDGVAVGTVRHEWYVLGQYWSRHVSIHTTKSNFSPQHAPYRKNSSKMTRAAVNPSPLYAAHAEVSSQSGSNIGLRTHTPRLSIVSATPALSGALSQSITCVSAVLSAVASVWMLAAR